MALYTEACAVVRADAGLSEGWFALSPLLFAVVSNEERSGLLSELLYADYFVLMAPTMEQLDRRVHNTYYCSLNNCMLRERSRRVPC